MSKKIDSKEAPKKDVKVNLDYFAEVKNIGPSKKYRLFYEVGNDYAVMKTVAEWEKIFKKCFGK